MNRTLLLIDGSNLAFRMYFALEMTNLRDSQGNPTWAIYGVLKALFDSIEFAKPEAIACAFDLAEPTHRHEIFEDYKANRPDEMPKELSCQWNLIKEIFDKFEIPILEEHGYEADDMIGIMAKKAEQAGFKVVILSGDKDLYQLVNDNIVMAVPQRGGGLEIFNTAHVIDKMGIPPKQVPDYKGIAGDSSDNIPGVKGLGPKAAIKLLSEFENLEEIYKHLDSINPIKTQEKLREQEAQARLSKHLATIITDPKGIKQCNLDLDRCTLNLPNTKTLIEFLKKLEFNSILKRLPIVLKPFNNGDLVKVDVGELPIQNKNTTTRTIENSIDKPLEKYQAKPFVIFDNNGLKLLINQLKNFDHYAIDLETDGLNTLNCSIAGIALAYKDETEIKSFYIPTLNTNIKHLNINCVLEELKIILEDKDKKQIIQNAKFEHKILSRHQIKIHENFFDTMLASYIKNSNDKHGLKAQIRRIFHKKMTELEQILGTGRNAKSIDSIELQEIAEYAGADAQACLELYYYYLQNLSPRESKILDEIELPLVKVLQEMEMRGLSLDKEFLENLSKEINDKIIDLEKAIFEITKQEFNLSSPKQLSNILFETMQLPIIGKKNKSGSYSTDMDTLEALLIENISESQKNLLNYIINYRVLSKLTSTYIDVLPNMVSKEDNRLHSDFNQVVTATGRLSSSNPNLQNIPIRSKYGKLIRKAFVAVNEDFLILSADYSQIELRILAHLAQEPALIKAFNNQEDIHKRTAMEIFGLELNQITDYERNIGKTLNFALIYMQGAFATAKQLGISQKDAKFFIDKYFESFKLIKPYLNRVLEKAHRDCFVETLFGRRRYFQNINSPNKMLAKEEERQAFNAVIQGSAADIIKIAMNDLDRKLENFKSKIILQVHDELVLEVEKNEIEQVSQLVQSSMSRAVELSVDLQVDINIGKTWLC